MERVTGWLRRAVVPVVLTVACVLGLVGAATAATAPTLPEVVLAQSGHWAVDKATDSVVHVHGGTRQVDARVALPADAADARTALQGDTQGFVVGRDRAWAFDKATLTVDPPIPLPAADETPVGIETPGGPYLVYRGRGTIVRLGAPTAVVEAGGPLGPPVRTNDGTVWVHRPDNASLYAFRRGAISLDPAVPARTPGGLTVTAPADRGQDIATFVDTGDERARQVRDGALAPGSTLGADLPTDTLLADQTTPTRLPVVDPTPRLRLLDATGIPTDTPAGAPLDVPLGPGTYSAPLVSGDVVALLELASSTLLTFTDQGTKVSELPLPAGTTPDQLHRGEDGRIYVDEAGKTHVVAPDGTITTVDLTGTGTGGTGIAVAAPENQRNPVTPPPPGAVTIPRSDPGLAAPAPGGPAVAAPPVPNLPGPGPTGPGAPNPGGTGPVAGGTPPEQGTTTEPPLPPPPPATPVGVTATLTGPDRARVTWTAGNGGGDATSYTITRSDGATTTSTSRSVASTGLAAGTTYTFTVTATNAAGASTASAPSNAVTGDVGKPPPPTGLTADRQNQSGSTGVALAWAAPASAQGWSITGYQVSTSNSTQTVPGATEYYDGSSEHFCTPGITYRVSTNALIESGGRVVSAESEPATITVTEPVDCTYPSRITSATANADGSVTVEAVCETDIRGPRQDTSIAVRFDGTTKGTQQCGEGENPGNTDDPHTFTVTGLDPGTTYSVTTRTTSPSGSKTSSAVTVTTAS